MDCTASGALPLLAALSMWYVRFMEACTDDTWVTAVSVEDPSGRIHEFELPEGACRHSEFVARFTTEWRRRYVDRAASARVAHRDTLSDLLVVFLLGFLTFIVFNIMFGPKNLGPLDFNWCVYSMSRGGCVADIG